MKMKVKNKELNSVITNLDDDSIQINHYFDDLLNQISELKKIWEGTAAVEFYYKAEIYINYLKSVPSIYNELSAVMKKSNDTYQKLDQLYAQLMKKAVVKHE